MTREEAIEYWEQFNAEIDGLYDACSDAERDVLVKQREIVEYTISALRKQEPVSNRNGLNEPLTLEELRKIDGEPVWLVNQNGGRWVIMSGAYLWDSRKNADYGKTWLAYRQKPEEGDHE